jgi:hypothetical protein
VIRDRRFNAPLLPRGSLPRSIDSGQSTINNESDIAKS